MNCQAETPAARATTSSWLRVSRQKVNMAPKRMAKWTVFCTVSGSFSSVRPMVMAKVTSSLSATRRSISTNSKRRMTPVSTSISIRNQKMNCRAI